MGYRKRHKHKWEVNNASKSNSETTKKFRAICCDTLPVSPLLAIIHREGPKLCNYTGRALSWCKHGPTKGGVKTLDYPRYAVRADMYEKSPGLGVPSPTCYQCGLDILSSLISSLLPPRLCLCNQLSTRKRLPLN